jgi:hypothetical protein
MRTIFVKRFFGSSLHSVLSGVRTLALVALLAWGTERQASAYTDPGSGALIWQMLMAGFVGALFYVRRITSWFRRKRGVKD